MPYIELVTVVKKLYLRLATFQCFNQIYKKSNWHIHITSSNHILVIRMGDQSNLSTATINPHVGR